MYREGLGGWRAGNSRSTGQAAEAMNEIMNGEATPAPFGAFVTALRLKGETPDEIAGMAQVMREKALRVNVDGPLVDTCGTGGDASGSSNIYTTAGFVVAGTGLKVAKQRTRARAGAGRSARGPQRRWGEAERTTAAGGTVPRCDEAGIFGAVAGAVGSLQAVEILKEVLGLGASLSGHLLLYDALGTNVRKIRVPRDPECPLCGDNPTGRGILAYEGVCGAPVRGGHVLGAQS